MTTIRTTTGSTRQAAINGLAIVGFIVLVIVGMILAVYAASYVPKAISRIGSAAVYLSSVFVGNEDQKSDLVVVPPETVPFTDATSTPSAATTTTSVETPTKTETKPASTPAAGGTTTTVHPIGGTVVPTTLSGLPDLTVAITATGYLTSSDTSSFVKSDTVPDGKRGAVKFSILNQGTNVSGSFRFEAELPTTSSTYTFRSDSQSSLRPGERIDYVLGFDRAKSGNDREITITVDPNTNVSESNERNNDATVRVDIGS